MVQENKRKENATYFSRKFSKKMLPETDGCQLNTRVGEFDVIIYKIKTLKVSLAIMFVIFSICPAARSARLLIFLFNSQYKSTYILKPGFGAHISKIIHPSHLKPVIILLIIIIDCKILLVSSLILPQLPYSP